MARLIHRHRRKLTSEARRQLDNGWWDARRRRLPESILRELWDEHREELIRESCRDLAGRRPWAYWRFDAGRPEHLTPYPLDPPEGEPTWGEAHGRALDDYSFEPVLFLAERGELLEDEVDAIREAALEAADRVGTDRERRGTTYAVSEDRSAVRLAIRVDRALGEPSGDYGEHEPPYDS